MHWKYLLSSILIPSLTIADKRRHFSTVVQDLDTIETEAAKAPTDHTTSSVEGKGFDKFFIIWLENQDYDIVANDPNIKWLSQYGVTLDNYWALTHPSQPNYIAAVGGDYFGLDTDEFVTLPKNVSTIADLLDDKHISWGEYQEHMPYSGYKGYNFSNQETYANDYVRKHNPLITFDSVSEDESRLAKIKNFTEFEKDLENKVLPQWAFITPNMTNNAHDTNMTVAGKWCKDFLEPLLKNEYFMKDTLILLTLDENETYEKQDKAYALLLGGALDKSSHGTTDSTYYTHYSEISTIEANWDLYNLGRHDTNIDGNANIFEDLAKKIGYTNKDFDTSKQYNNKSVDGYFNDKSKPLPGINCSAIGVNGKGVLPLISDKWCSDTE